MRPTVRATSAWTGRAPAIPQPLGRAIHTHASTLAKLQAPCTQAGRGGASRQILTIWGFTVVPFATAKVFCATSLASHLPGKRSDWTNASQGEPTGWELGLFLWIHTASSNTTSCNSEPWTGEHSVRRRRNFIRGSIATKIPFNIIW